VSKLPLSEIQARAVAHLRAGDAVEAERLCRTILDSDRSNVQALRLLSAIAARRGQLLEAVALLDRVAAVDESVAEVHAARASMLNALARFDEAITACDCALALGSNAPELFVIRGVALHSLGRPSDALDDYDRALALRPRFAGVLANRGAALSDLSRYEESLAAYDAALAIEPTLPEAVTNRAAVLAKLSRFDEALATAEHAIALMPGFHEAWHNRGVAFAGLKRYDEAIASYTQALALKPDFAVSLQDRASALAFLKNFEAAERDYTQAAAIQPGLPFVQGNVLHARLHCAVWRGYAEAAARVRADVREGRQACEPLSLLAISESAEELRIAARTWMRRYYPPGPTPVWRGERYRHDRIRVAYLSADFHEHATAYLMAGLFERHDRERFEVTAVSWGPDVASPMRARLMAAFEYFVDVRHLRDDEVARMLREREIDIAVDLKGYTYDGRLGILARRPAPVQVSYLGYPGTLGAPYVDYLVADAMLVPPTDRVHYDEKVVYLPDSYQPNDRQRPIASIPTRSEAGLPEEGFIFCSFNNTYKITPQVFDIWMRLLRTVDGSVLWLLECNAVAPNNLRAEAHARGVAPERLIFAPSAPLAEHLARHRLADLFLDTLPCNAHTTASDALWASLPVLTCLGQTFAGRVAGSLLRAAGLPELATESLDAYEALAVRLATQPEELQSLRTRLAWNRSEKALFDADRTRKHLETAFATMRDRQQAGLLPDHFAVPPQ
jgi:predicted O-linked N-acetylglucosamine transferase (SPINDLY family)